MKYIFIYTALFFSTKATAVVGQNLSSSFDPVCKISIYNHESKFKASCTGTLIAPDTVQTAAHCIFKEASYEVECGQTNFSKKNAKTAKVSPGKIYYTSGPNFREKHKVISALKQYQFLDRALLKINGRSKIEPAQLTSVKKLKNLIKNNKCYFSGYGRSDGIVGSLNTVKIKTKALKINYKSGVFTFTIPKTEPDRDVYLMNLQPNFKTQGSVAPGDSGSSVICTEQGKLLSFGVTSSIGNKDNSPYAMSIQAAFSFSLEDDLNQEINSY